MSGAEAGLAWDVNARGTYHAVRAAAAAGHSRFINTSPVASLVGHHQQHHHAITEAVPPSPGPLPSVVLSGEQVSAENKLAAWGFCSRVKAPVLLAGLWLYSISKAVGHEITRVGQNRQAVTAVYTTAACVLVLIGRLAQVFAAAHPSLHVIRLLVSGFFAADLPPGTPPPGLRPLSVTSVPAQLHPACTQLHTACTQR